MRKPKGYWTKDRVFEESKKYQTRSGFKKSCLGAYKVALKNAWLDEMDWFKEPQRPNGYWTKERVFEESRKYQTRYEFQKSCRGAYNVAWKNYWLGEMCWLVRPKNTNKKWTKERVFEESIKYKTRGEFCKCSSGAYNAALKNGWLVEMGWLKEDRKPNGYWTKERVFEESKKYSLKSEFSMGCGTAYTVARKNHWLDEMVWLKERHKPNGYWTKERVFEESRKYQTRTEFVKCCGGAYRAALYGGWLVEMGWLKEDRKPNGYWTKERVFEESKKYQTRGEFCKKCSSAYQPALKNGWLDEMDWLKDGRLKLFMDKIDCVYRYFFKETNSIYVGRSIDRKYRDNHHRTEEGDTVLSHANENGLEVPTMEIIEDNLTLEEGQEREDYWKLYYRHNGYNILNKAKTGKGVGSLGAINHGKWTKERVFEEARKYQTRGEFQKSCGSAYNTAHKNHWLDEMVWFKETRKPSGYWTKDRVFEEARKYQTRGEFQESCGGAYNIARRNRWLDEMFPKNKMQS